MKPITKIAQELGIEEEELEPYGRYKAKVNDKLFQRVKDRKVQQRPDDPPVL